MSSSYMMTSPSTQWHIVHCPFCWSVLRDVRLIRETYFICIPDCWSVPASFPMSLADQVITLVAANKRLMLDVDTAKTKEFQLGMLDYIHVQHAELVTKINEEKVLDDAITEQIVEAVKEYKSR